MVTKNLNITYGKASNADPSIYMFRKYGNVVSIFVALKINQSLNKYDILLTLPSGCEPTRMIYVNAYNANTHNITLLRLNSSGSLLVDEAMSVASEGSIFLFVNITYVV